MRERAELLLKIACGLLIALLLYQTGRALVRNHPFAHVAIPSLPTLAVDTNAVPTAGSMATGPGIKIPAIGRTNLSAETNQAGTNLMAALTATNQGTNLPPMLSPDNMAAHAPGRTNRFASSNLLAQAGGMVSTNGGANSMGTNAMTTGPHKRKSRSGHSPMMGMGFMPGMGGPGKPLPAVEQARIDKIISSEFFGPVPHPLPMALLGIAGNTAFLRSDSGETGLVKEGDSLGNLKLLRIGINRVLIEQNGQKQELTIFDGMGSDSLLTTSEKNSNETIKH